MVEASGRAVEHVAVGVGTAEPGEQVDEARGRERLRWVFVWIRVQVAHDQRGRTAGARRIAGEPRGQRRGGARARAIAIALSVAEVRISALPHEDPFDFQWFTATVKRSRVAAWTKLCASARAVAVRVEIEIAPRVEHGGLAERRDAIAPVEHADRDLLIAESVRSGVDDFDRRPGSLCQRFGELPHRAARGRAVVLELGERKHVGIGGGERCEDLRALARELASAPSAAGRESTARSVAIEEVLDVPGRDAQRAARHARRLGPRTAAAKRTGTVGWMRKLPNAKSTTPSSDSVRSPSRSARPAVVSR